MKKPIRSIIDNIQDFHIGLSSYFQSLKESAYDERSIMLLNYISKRENHIANNLKEYLQDSDDKVLERGLEVAPCLPTNIFNKCSKDLDNCSPLYVDDIIAIAIHYDDCLIDFFTLLVKETEGTNAEPIFRNFLRQTQNEQKKLARDSLWCQDL